ncbi:transposon Tf2-2 polyprotein [Tanacetum coccineum]
MVSTERDAKSRAKTLSAMQFKKGFNKSEPCYLAVTRLETDEGSSKVKVPKVIGECIAEFKECICPRSCPRNLPPRMEVESYIELETGSKPPAKALTECHTPDFQLWKDQCLALETGCSSCYEPRTYVKVGEMLFRPDEDDSLGHKIKDGRLDDGTSYHGDDSAIASPLTDLLKKNKAWIWDEECQAHREFVGSGHGLVVADALSRKAEFAAITQAQFFLQDRIKEGLEHDPLAKKIIALAKDGRTRRFWLKGDMLFTKGDRPLQKWGGRVILKECHDSKWAGHPGIKRTLALVEGTYYWPRMEDDGRTIVRTSPFELVTGRQPLTPNALAASYEGSSPAAYKTMKEWHEQADLARASLDKAAKKISKIGDERRRTRRVRGRRSSDGEALASTIQVAKEALSWRREDQNEGCPSGDQQSCLLDDREVEEILSDRTIRRRGVPSYKEYLIKWRDLPDSEASWEAEDLLWQFATNDQDITMMMARRGLPRAYVGDVTPRPIFTRNRYEGYGSS